MKAVCWCVVVVVLVFFCDIINGSLCPENSQPFTENKCLSVVSDSSSFSNAQPLCGANNAGILAIFTTNSELLTISSYVTALSTDSDYYWIGYSYNGAQLEDTDGNIAPSFLTNVIVNNNIAEETGTCIAVNKNGDFIRRSCANLLGYVCLFNLTEPSVSMITVDGIAVMYMATVSIGANVSIECSLSNTANSSVVEWSFNGAPITNQGIITTSISVNTTELMLLPFLLVGVYRCMVTNADGQTASATVQLFGDIENIVAPPTPVTGFGGFAQTQSSLFIQWNEPDRTYVISPLLVSYTLYYSTERPLNYTTSATISNLRTGLNGKGTYILNGLQAGTTYFLGMRAENAMGISDDPPFTQIATTYGNAPDTAPTNLVVSRNREDTALLAEWSSVITSPPTGRIAFYQVEFRDAREDSDSEDIIVLFIGPRNMAASIFNVRGAQGYEVRVAAGVQIERNPISHVLGPFSDWQQSEAVIPNIPVVPTIQFVEDDSTVVIVSTVVPIVVASLVTVLIVTVIAIWISRKKAGKENNHADGGYVCSKCKSVSPFTSTEQQELQQLHDDETKT